MATLVVQSESITEKFGPHLSKSTGLRMPSNNFDPAQKEQDDEQRRTRAQAAIAHAKLLARYFDNR